MIYLVGIPQNKPPFALSRSDRENIVEFINKNVIDEEIYIAATGEKLLKIYDFETTDEMRKEGSENPLKYWGYSLVHLANLIDKVGSDVMLYKAFWMDKYQTQPVDKWETYLDYSRRDLDIQKVFYSEEEAKAALADESEWNFNKGEEAREELRKLLA